jgi:hypothetical protein
MKQLDKWKDKLDPVQAEDVRKRVVNQLSVSRSRDISIQRTTEGGGTPWHRLLQSGVETAAADPYNTTLDNGRWTGGPVKLTEMTVSEVRDLQNRMLSNPENRARYKDAAGNAVGSSAVGAPQIVGKTLQGLIDRGVVDPDASLTRIYRIKSSLIWRSSAALMSQRSDRNGTASRMSPRGLFGQPTRNRSVRMLRSAPVIGQASWRERRPTLSSRLRHWASATMRFLRLSIE